MKPIKFLFGAVAALFLMGPQIVILPLAFNGGAFLTYPLDGVSLRWFRVLIEEPAWRVAIMNSLLIGGATALLASLLGTLAALGLRDRFGVPASLARTAFLLPVAVPTVVLGVGMQLVFSQLGLSSSYTGVIVSHTVISIPFVLLSVSGALAGIDRSVELAAASLGARRHTVFRLVTLPMAMPGILTGGVFAFATSLDEVVLILFLAGPSQRTISREMFTQMRDNLNPAIAAAAFSLIVATFCVGALSLWLRRRHRRMTAPDPSA